MDRIRSIRDKYGVSQPKTSLDSESRRNADYQQLINKTVGAGYPKADLYEAEKRRYLEASLGTSNGRGEVAGRSLSTTGFGTQDLKTIDYSRKVDRAGLLDQADFIASRKKMVDDYSASGSHTRNFSREAPRHQEDLTREREVLARDYSRGREENRTPESSTRYIHSRSTYSQKNTDYISPLKMMSEFDNSKNSRKKETESSDSFWREREARLTELTANRLNESQRISLFKDER